MRNNEGVALKRLGGSVWLKTTFSSAFSLSPLHPHWSSCFGVCPHTLFPLLASPGRLDHLYFLSFSFSFCHFVHPHFAVSNQESKSFLIRVYLPQTHKLNSWGEVHLLSCGTHFSLFSFTVHTNTHHTPQTLLTIHLVENICLTMAQVILSTIKTRSLTNAQREPFTTFFSLFLFSTLRYGRVFYKICILYIIFYYIIFVCNIYHLFIKCTFIFYKNKIQIKPNQELLISFCLRKKSLFSSFSFSCRSDQKNCATTGDNKWSYCHSFSADCAHKPLGPLFSLSVCQPSLAHVCECGQCAQCRVAKGREGQRG